MQYPIQYSDPPWSYDNRMQHGGAGKPYTSGASSHYPTMEDSELIAMSEWVRSITPDRAIHFMWTTGPRLGFAITLLKSWGFKYKTIAFVWDKCRVNPGHYTMSQTELVIVGVKGAVPKPRGARNVRQLVTEARTRHSAKPAEVRRRIDEMFPPAQGLHRIELFARGKLPPPWVAWGNEAVNVES